MPPAWCLLKKELSILGKDFDVAADVSELLGHGGYRLSVSGFAFHAFIIPDRQYDNLDFNAGRRIFEGDKRYFQHRAAQK